MSDNLDRFIRENRPQFDNCEPADNLWAKIAARIELRHPTRISSKWLSKLTQVALSASIVACAVYFISMNTGHPSLSNAVPNGPGAVKPVLKLNSPIIASEAAAHGANGNSYPAYATDKNAGRSKHSIATKQPSEVFSDTDTLRKTEDIGSRPAGTATPHTQEARLSVHSGSVAAPPKEKKVTVKTDSENAPLRRPAEPENMNSYAGSIYNGDQLCEMLDSYRFPGRFKRNHYEFYKVVVKTVSCSRFRDMPDVKAVWLIGKTEKEVAVTLKNKFSNMYLTKADGRKIYPIAISHYYPGMGVISEYRGKQFDMIFNDRVELILLFKNAEEGDVMEIDGVLKTILTY